MHEVFQSVRAHPGLSGFRRRVSLHGWSAASAMQTPFHSAKVDKPSLSYDQWSET
jgi:hypothetical protein